MESIPASPAQRKALKIAELREACELAGVDTTGTKAVLLDRLEEVSPFNCHISRSIVADGDSPSRLDHAGKPKFERRATPPERRDERVCGRSTLPTSRAETDPAGNARAATQRRLYYSGDWLGTRIAALRNRFGMRAAA